MAENLIFTRPAQWAGMELPGWNLINAPVFGDAPVLRQGQPMGDSVGGLATKAGLKRLIELFEEHKPRAFLWWAMYGMHDKDKRRLESVKFALQVCRDIAPDCVFFYGNGNQASTISDGEPDFNVEAFSDVIDVVLDNTRDPGIETIYTSRGFKFDTLHTFGFDPNHIGDYSGMPATKDVFFGGSYTGRSRFPNSAFRHDLLTALDERFDLEVRGRGHWPVPHKPYVHAMDYPKVIGAAKVALGCYHADIVRYYTKRTTYSLAVGRPYVVRYIPCMEDDGFVNGENVAVYKDVAGAVAWVGRLVRDPGLAKSIGQAGRKLAVERFSWEARLKEMGALLKEHA